MSRRLGQYAAWPYVLEGLVARIEYRPGWTLHLADIDRDPADSHGEVAGGLTLVIYADVDDAYHPLHHRPVNHYFIVPAATYNEQAWLRWIFDCLLKVEQHETSEWFQLVAGGDGLLVPGNSRPFAPTHGPGDDPYTIKEYASHTQRRTSFRGQVNP